VIIVQIIARVNRGGTANWLRVLAQGLKANGDKVYLIAGNVDSNELEDPVFNELNGIRVPNLGRSVSIISDFKAITQIRKLVKELKPEIVNTHTAKAGVLGRIACIGLSSKVVHTYHGHLLYGYFSVFKTKLIILIERILTISTDAYISVGSKVKDDLIKNGIGNFSKFKVIFPAVEKPQIVGQKVARDFLGISPDLKVIGWMGRLTSIKRPERILELAKQFPQVTFLIAGFGELDQEMKLAAGSNVKFVGWIKPFIFWQACDVALLTSDNEGVPTSLIEAAVCGLPIVAENVGSVSDIFEPNIGGYLVNNVESRKEALNKLISDPNFAKQMGESAKEYSDERFSIGKFVKDHIELYESLIKVP